MTCNEWIQNNYTNICEWSKNITRGDQLSKELAHYAIWQMLEHPKREALAMRERDFPDTLKYFMLSIIRNSWYGKKSPFSLVEKQHRTDIGQVKKTIDEKSFWDSVANAKHEEYDYYKDELIDAIYTILNEMSKSTDREWYLAKLFKMWIEFQNFSEMSRITGIPRTSISKAVKEGKEYILHELYLRNLLS